MKTNAIDFIKEKIICQEKSYGIDITTNLAKAWIGEFEEIEKQRKVEQDKFFEEFENSDRQFPHELFVANNERVKQELQSIISEWHESKFQKPLIELIRERLN